ncbi:hypothetical protein P9452_01855 [Bacillus mycoides]|uniref:hypothetical protein n=1 Tax=Bacillus mycoides TaxID=1405 RepID=UPI002E1E6273|nr:hypothetical protein [Bacillus mycoides]
MRTNIKNGTICLGLVSTTAGGLRIGDNRLMNVRYATEADFLQVIAETDEKGVVKSLSINVNCKTDEIFNNVIRHINPNKVFTGTIIDPKDFFTDDGIEGEGK